MLLRASSGLARRPWSRLAPALLLVASCATAGEGPDPGDDEAPLGDYDAILGGAPGNDSLPDENKADAVYPKQSTELVASQSAVKSQGSRGVCSIFSTVALMEHLYIRAGITAARRCRSTWWSPLPTPARR